MAELSGIETAHGCCAAEHQQTCCDPSQKGECCTPEASSCGCSAGQSEPAADLIPLPDESVDVVISNCVLNLSADKPQAIREAARVLRSGGRFAISDVIADPDMDPATGVDMQQWTGCVAGALTCDEFERTLADAGLREVQIRETHRVHEHAAAAIVRALKR